MAKREANLELGSGDVARAASVHAVEPLPEHHRVLHLQLADSPADYEKFQYLGL